jgi:hypothetical protein
MRVYKAPGALDQWLDLNSSYFGLFRADMYGNTKNKTKMKLSDKSIVF